MFTVYITVVTCDLGNARARRGSPSVFNCSRLSRILWPARAAWYQTLLDWAGIAQKANNRTSHSTSIIIYNM